MDDRSVAQLTLLATLANLTVNQEILEVSRKLLKVNEEHLEVLKRLANKDYEKDAREL